MALFFMKYRLISLIGLAVAAAVLAAGCGSGSPSVTADDVAVVGDTHISKDQFDALMAQACKSYQAQKRECPKAGTAEYTALRKQAIQFLVQRAEFDQKADDLGLKISDADVDKQLEQIKTQYFGKNGKCDAACEAKFHKQLSDQGLSLDQVRKDVRASVVQSKLYAKVTEGTNVTDKDISDYYKKNKQQYVQPESRDVRHILVKKKALADQLYQQLQNGGNFAALAKRYSTDPSSKDQGGKLTVSKGRQVPEFDKAAFALKVHQLSQPVKTQYGWHIIEAMTAIKKATTTPLSEVKSAIRQQLVGQKKQDAMNKWVNETQKAFEKKTSYQIGYEPPADTTGSTGSTTP